ncbi:hypothetical protein ASPSYDRAFT_957415 [Aspergillus sydowii CBS 593.65]|uniref:Uncharacterized protein n=1 Tax=Aspergillus sydowii CBS 593.65 TaxID=1036612 RepID=A0A1L9TGM8_9EURO|nr:uncharacterized protein ASPSYDRAFT_957415 [Aspergillus sydowii CBS 593.65]OJJ58590.1 hypothetical protein ASPSYDRAFT_957415 [Aspergillus sydowii CBS 593.65]
MCKANIGNIKGRELLQTLPSYAYNTEKTVEHGPCCIKIPATGAGLSAWQTLLRDGIRTLGTAVFSVHEGIAASQAGCLYISDYYNGAPQVAGVKYKTRIPLSL